VRIDNRAPAFEIAALPPRAEIMWLRLNLELLAAAQATERPPQDLSAGQGRILSRRSARRTGVITAPRNLVGIGFN